MNYFVRAGFVFASLAALSVSAIAAPLTGVWHGKLRIDTSKLPNVTDPNQKKMMLAQIKSNEQMTLTLTVKGDHTFTISTIGGPKQSAPVNGTWAEAPNSFSIQPMKAGKPQQKSTFVVAKDKKSLTLTQGPATVTFFR